MTPTRVRGYHILSSSFNQINMTDSTVSSSVDDDAPNTNPMVAATFKIAP